MIFPSPSCIFPHSSLLSNVLEVSGKNLREGYYGKSIFHLPFTYFFSCFLGFLSFSFFFLLGGDVLYTFCIPPGFILLKIWQSNIISCKNDWLLSRDVVLVRELHLHQGCVRHQGLQDDRVDGSHRDGHIQGEQKLRTTYSSGCESTYFGLLLGNVRLLFRFFLEVPG